MEEVIETDIEAVILEHRFMGDSSANEVSVMLRIPIGQLYTLENDLKSRICTAIRGATE